MASVPNVLCCFLASVLYVHLAEAQSIPDRCRCPSAAKFLPYKQIEEFVVIPKRARCSTKEIILTMKNVKEESGQVDQRCLNVDTKQAVILQSCWDRKNPDGRRATVKVSECVKAAGKESESSGKEGLTAEARTENPKTLKTGLPGVL